MYSVYTEGGIYLDSDVEMLKTFDDLLHHKSFIGFEAATGLIEAAIFGGEAGNVWCQKAMEFYQDKHFQVNVDGGIDSEFLAPNVLQAALLSTYQDFPSCPPDKPILIGGENGICVYPTEYFSPLKYDIEKSRGGAKKPCPINTNPIPPPIVFIALPLHGAGKYPCTSGYGTISKGDTGSNGSLN